MTNIIEVKNSLEILLIYRDCIAWLESSDRGNPCYDPYKFDTEEERMEDAMTLAAVKIVMPKGSLLHLNFNKAIAQQIGNHYVTYDWLIKSLSRVLTHTSYKELVEMIHLSAAIRVGMKQRGLTTISNVAEAFA